MVGEVKHEDNCLVIELRINQLRVHSVPPLLAIFGFPPFLSFYHLWIHIMCKLKNKIRQCNKKWFLKSNITLQIFQISIREKGLFKIVKITISKRIVISKISFICVPKILFYPDGKVDGSMYTYRFNNI